MHSLVPFSLLFFYVLSLSSTIPNGHHHPDNNMLLSESETLFKIMESMSSDLNWRISHPNPCQPGSSWPGIECKIGEDNIFHVSRLDFGASPNPTCKNSSTFPSLIFSLPHLQSVFFFNCFTHAKTTFSLLPNSPSSSLQQLSFRSNPGLIGPIPRQIASLKTLNILTLAQNSLTGEIPKEIFSLISLVHLDLSYNMFSGTIPSELGDLKNLVGLDLSYNLLTGSIPATIGELGLLQKLDLSSNSLVGTIPDSIEKLNSLGFFALSSNRVHGKFPEGLEKLQNLQYFIMDDNPMNITLPSEFGKLLKLQVLGLANSGYSGNIPPSFSKLVNLSTLSLQNNRLTGEIPAGFGDLSYIYHLNLSRNFLSGVVPFNSGFLERLGRNLDLSGNSGLCLSPSEAFSVKIGVDVCGRNISGSLFHPFKSEASSGWFSQQVFMFGFLGVLMSNEMLFLG